jgi:hypothetical protein
MVPDLYSDIFEFVILMCSFCFTKREPTAHRDDEIDPKIRGKRRMELETWRALNFISLCDLHITE